MIVLRPEQRTAVDAGKKILAQYRCVYYAAEVRVGKNFISFTTAKESGWKRVVFVTKKKALIGVNSDYNQWGQSFERFTAINFEQAHKFNEQVDGWIIDEAHACGQYAKPSNRTKILREKIGLKPVMYLSGSPHPESPSQIFHQFWICQYGPFQKYKNFYAWSKDYVNVKQKRINGWTVNDYSHAKEKEVQEAIRPYMVHLSQQEAGFTALVEEEILRVPIDERLYKLMEILKKDRVYTLKNGEVLIADTAVKLQSLFHQLSSGTVTIAKIVNEKEVRLRFTLDQSKAYFIASKFAGQKISIFYKFIAEGEMLKKIFTNWTDNPEEFNKREDVTFICQIVSGREGVNLSTADALVMYNIDFSATSYWQGRARMQTKDRVKPAKLFWIFSERGIEDKVYQAVSNKMNYTSQFFVKDFKVKKWPKVLSRKK
jgi:hypothetical protein